MTSLTCGDWLLFIFVFIPLLIVTNVMSFALSLALFPILVPIYMVKGDELFTADFFNKDGPDFFFRITSKYTIIFCYWLLCPVWIIPKTLYKRYKTSSYTETQRPTVYTDCLLVFFVIIPLCIVTNVISLVLTLALFPILVPIYMVKGDDWFTDDFFNNDGCDIMWGFTSKYTILFCYWLLYAVWIILKTLTYKLYKCSKALSNIETQQPPVNTVTRQVPQPTVSQQRVISQPKQDQEDTNFQMAILQSQMLDLNRKIDQMNRNQNQSEGPTPSGMCQIF